MESVLAATIESSVPQNTETQPVLPSVMKAYQVSETGNILEKLILSTDLPLPSVGPKDVLVKVHAAGLNPADWKIVASPSIINSQFKFPLTLLYEFSGVIVGKGVDVTYWDIGAAVYGWNSIGTVGALAEYIVISSDKITLKPKNLSFEEAAGASCVGNTTYQALVTKGNLQKGDKVFVNGGSTACGVLGIQLAKLLGCYVVATCSKRTRDFVASFQPDQLIDYEEEKWDKVLAGGEFTFLYDCIGDAWEPAQSILKPSNESRVVCVAVKTDQDITLGGVAQMGADILGRKFWNFVGSSPNFVLVLVDADNAESRKQLDTLLSEGNIRIPIDHVYTFDQSWEAFEKLKSGRAKGKLVIKIAEE